MKISLPVLLNACVALLLPAFLPAQTSWTITRTNVPGVERANAIAFGNGRFVAATSGSASVRPGAVWSNDGLTWHASSLPDINGLGMVFSGGSFYMATFYAGVWRSVDGDTWQQVLAPPKPGLGFRYIATDGHSLLVTNADNNAGTHFYSPDGITWRETAPLSTPFNGFSYYLGYAAGRYVLFTYVNDPGGQQTRHVTSTTDGTQWIRLPSLDSADAFTTGNGRIVAVTGTSGQVSPAALTSVDGDTIVRTPITSAIVGNPTIAGIQMGFAGGRYFFLDSLYASSDGVAWAPLASAAPARRVLYSIAYGNGRYVAVGQTYDSPNTDVVAVLATTNTPPIISTGPADRTVVEGARVTFSVTLENPSTATTFQWKRDGVAISGATTANYTIDAAKLSDSARFTVDLRNDLGATTSDPALLTVVPIAQAGRIVNLSVLTSLDRAGDTFTLGFVVGGSGTVGSKSLLARAGGPSLTSFGVGNPNADPKFELWSAGAKVAENDNWAGSATTSATIAQLGAFAFLAADSKDAALVATVPKGDSSMIVSANGNATGAVIAELYDATPSASITSSTPRLINVSVLKNISAGASISAGFVIGGATDKTVLIRAVGPGLAAFNVPGALADPALALYRSGTASAIAANDNWAGAVELTNAFASVGAFALPPLSKDAALITTLRPGNYTVQVSGVGNANGLALVEVYEVP